MGNTETYTADSGRVYHGSSSREYCAVCGLSKPLDRKGKCEGCRGTSRYSSFSKRYCRVCGNSDCTCSDRYPYNCDHDRDSFSHRDDSSIRIPSPLPDYEKRIQEMIERRNPWSCPHCSTTTRPRAMPLCGRNICRRCDRSSPWKPTSHKQTEEELREIKERLQAEKLDEKRKHAEDHRNWVICPHCSNHIVQPPLETLVNNTYRCGVCMDLVSWSQPY